MLGLCVATFAACKDDDNTTDQNQLQAQILNDFSANITQATYNELSAQTIALNTAVIQLKANPTDAKLTECRNLWKAARLVWEKSESFLFGPVATENIDPRIDTWPVNFADLDAVIASGDELSPAYIDNLEDALKGFHPIEYLLWGQDGNKTAADFNARQLDYLEALALNLKDLTGQLSTRWNPATQDNYSTAFISAGSGSALYPTKRSAFEELVNGMAGICDEVANGKIFEPFNAQDPSLEESPFSGNSITDFTNNIKGVEAVYKGVILTVDGKGLEDFVREHNLSLDNTIKTKLATAIGALNNITLPFGQAITQQPVQVQTAMDAINDLKTTLEDELLPLVQLHTN